MHNDAAWTPSTTMNHPLSCKALTLACVVTFIALPSAAADRVRAGQWETTLKLGAQSITRSTCMSQADADAINGDANSIRAWADKVNAPTGCKVTNVKVSGNQISVTSVCASGTQNVGTTTYHGDSLESVNTNGAKSQSKWVGACK
jgi:hypothetical protein